MKCATTTIHHVLNQHPGIFMPHGEVLYFDVDEINVRPENFGRIGDEWIVPVFDETMFRWYCSHFVPAKSEQLIGEDSPSYLSSEKAPQRILDTIPNVKLIFSLRDPVDRAYSHYWHNVRTGRAMFDFEDTLRYAPGSIIERGLYKKQLDRYFQLFQREQIKIVLFEELKSDLIGQLNSIAEFLELDLSRHTFSNQHSNEVKRPRWLGPQLAINRHLRSYSGRYQLERLPLNLKCRPYTLWARMLLNLHRLINPITKNRPPQMKTSTRNSLSRFYANENRGLSELISRDLSQHWPSMQH